MFILDIRMQPMNGFKLSRELLKQDDKPILCFLTAFLVSLDEAKTLFPSLKVAGFMRKPIHIRDLVKAIQTMLNPPS